MQKAESIIKRITSFAECEAFVRDFCADKIFSDPMLSTDEQVACNLKKSIEKPESHAVIGVFKDGQMTGLFAFLTLHEERYLEMLVGLSRDKEAYRQMFTYLGENFPSYNADFVFNPNNYLLREFLEQKGAAFDTEQQKMIFARSSSPVMDTTGVELLSEAYIPMYLEMHNTDMYWTGDKVIKTPEKFRTLVAIEDGRVAGYMDVTHCFEENEPYDLLVKEEYRRKGYGRKLLAKALELNQPKGMMLLVEIDNEPAIRLYESMGFEKAENQNSLVAHYQL